MLDEKKIKKINREVFFFLLKKKIRKFVFETKLKLFKTELKENIPILFLKNLIICSILFLSLFILLGVEDCVETSSLDSLIVCIAAAGPVMMGLYYSGLTFVASTTQKKLPPKLQNLLLSDSINNRYLNLLMIMSEFSLMWILLEILFGKTLKYSGLLIWILFVWAIAAFIVLSRNFFSYLEVESWFDMIKRKIFRQFQEIIKTSLFQISDDYCAEIAVNAREYAEYFEIVCEKMKKNASSKDLRILSRKIIEILTNYQYYKRKIHPDSKWYFIQANEQKLYTLDDHDFIMSSKTMTSTVKYVNDFFWFEDKMDRIFITVFNKIQEKGDDQVSRKMLSELSYYLNALITNGFPERAFMIVAKIWVEFEKRLNDNTTNMNVSILSELYDMCIRIMLCSQNLCDYDEMKNRLEKGKLNYRFALSGAYEPFLLKEVLSLFEKIDYENQIEGRTITPITFAAKELALKLYTLYFNYFELLSLKMSSFFDQKRNTLKQNAKLKAVAVKKEAEYWKKWHFAIKTMFVKKMEVIPLDLFSHVNKIDMSKINNSEKEEKIRLCYALIDCLGNYTELQDDKIDIAGFSLNLGRLYLIDLVDTGFEKYRELIYVFLNASVAEFYYLIRSGENRNCYNPLVDLITSLGWLFVLFEMLDKPALSSYLKEVCEEMLKNMEKQKITAGIIVGIQNDIRIYRYETKQDWEKKVIDILKSSLVSKKSKLMPYLKEKIKGDFRRELPDGYDIFIAVNLVDSYEVSPFEFSYQQKKIYNELKQMGVV